MATKIKTTLCNIVALFPTSECWLDMVGGDATDMADYAVLVEAEHNQTHVVVCAEVADGYFDINVNGRAIDAISAVHLNGFTESGELITEAVMNGEVVDGVIVLNT